MSDRPVPVADDPDTGGFFEAASHGKLAIQLCRQCSEPVHLPLPRCPFCGSADLGWRNVAPDGRVYSWTVARHQIHPAFAVPYTILLVELCEFPGVRLVGYLDGDPPLSAGQTVRATFDTRAGVALPIWELTDFNKGELS